MKRAKAGKADTFDQKGWQKIRDARNKLAGAYKQDRLESGGPGSYSQDGDLYAKCRRMALKEHPFAHFDRRITQINLFNAILSVLTVGLGIMQVEIQWNSKKVTPASSRAVPDINEPANFSTFATSCSVLNLLLCLMLGLGVHLYYQTQLKKLKTRRLVLMAEGLFEADLLWGYLSELALCVVCPLPTVHGQIPWHGVGEFKTSYAVDDLLVLFMLPRLFQLYRCFLDLYGVNSCVLHTVAKRYDTEVDTLFMTKILVKRHPFKMVMMFTAFMLTCFAYAISIFERPTDLDFQHFRNCLWVAIVTYTTVGFGDIYPTTDLGRWACCLCCAASIFNLALLVMSVHDTFSMDTKEELVVYTFTKRMWKIERQKIAAIVIQRFWRSSMMSNNPLIPMIANRQWDKDIRLAKAIRDFRAHTKAEPGRVANLHALVQGTLLATKHTERNVEEILMLQGYM